MKVISVNLSNDHVCFFDENSYYSVSSYIRSLIEKSDEYVRWKENRKCQ